MSDNSTLTFRSGGVSLTLCPEAETQQSDAPVWHGPLLINGELLYLADYPGLAADVVAFLGLEAPEGDDPNLAWEDLLEMVVDRCNKNA